MLGGKCRVGVCAGTAHIFTLGPHPAVARARLAAASRLAISAPTNECIYGSGMPSHLPKQLRDTTPAGGGISVVRVDPLVWKRALSAADGDARRIEIIDERNVKVHNQRIR